MRVGINTLAYVPYRSGGDGTYVRELCHALARREDDNRYVLFVSPDNRDRLPGIDKGVHQVVCAVTGGTFSVRVAFEQAVLPALIQRERLDLLHCPVNVSPIMGRAPQVLTLLEAEPFMWPEALPFALAKYWQVMRRLSARKARRILTISQAAADELTTYMGVPADKLDPVYLGIDHSRFNTGHPRRPDAIAAIGESGYILWVGRAYPRKNLLRLIEAFGKLKLCGLPQKLVIAGPSGWQDEVVNRALSDHSLQNDVIRLGRVTDDEIPRLYAAADLFAFPSLHEAFGLPIAEAMACGTPVVTSERGAMKEVAGDAALLVNPESAGEIADAMRRLLTDEHLHREMRTRGLARAKLFDWDQTAAKTVEVYKNALNSGDRSKS